jgi:integrase/recombinase XerD
MAEISPLRRRMIEDMTIRNLSPATQRSYLNAVSKFSRYFGRSPDRLGLEDVRAFQVHLVATGMSWPAAQTEAVHDSRLEWCRPPILTASPTPS